MAPAKRPSALIHARRATPCLVILIAGVAHAQPEDPVDEDDIVDLPIIPVVEDAPPPEIRPGGAPALAVTYDKGIRFRSEDDAFEARLALRVQFRFETVRPLEDGAEVASTFYIPRGRLQLEGHVLGADTRYKLEAGLGDAGSFSFVKDLFLERKVGGTWIRAGQWKRPFNRQELVSDFGSELNERAITAGFAGGGRDLGVAIHNDYEKSPQGLEWVVGVFNTFSGGDDRPKTGVTCAQDPMTLVITCAAGNPKNFPDDFDPAVVLRAGWNKGKVKGYTEGDLEGGPLRLGVGASYKIDLANFKQGGEASVAKNLSHGVQVDGIAKVRGFDVQLGLFLMKLKSAKAQLGAMLQTGYFFVPGKIQAAGRLAVHQTADPDSNLVEGRVAFSYFFNGHAWKIASDAGFLKLTGPPKPEVQVRMMAQLTF